MLPRRHVAKEGDMCTQGAVSLAFKKLRPKVKNWLPTGTVCSFSFKNSPKQKGDNYFHVSVVTLRRIFIALNILLANAHTWCIFRHF